MLTPPTPTTSATTPAAPPAGAVPGPIGGAGPAPGSTTAPTGATGVPLAPQPATSEPAKAGTVEKMSPIMLWYAVSAFAYAAAFNKAVSDITTAPDGNGLFRLEQDVNQPVQATKEDQMDVDTKAYYNLNSKAIDTLLGETKTDKDGNTLTADQKTAERDAVVFDVEEAEGPDEPEEEPVP